MQKLQINTKRDWVITFVFSFLIIYLIALKFKISINEYLLQLTPDKISFFNQPDDQGVYAVIALAMLLLSLYAMMYKKVKIKYITMVLAGGIFITGAILGSYFYQCHLTLKVPSECEPEQVTVTYNEDRNSSHINYTLTEETKEQIVDKVLALEPLPKNEEIKLGDIDSENEFSISISYPEKQGQNYHIWVQVNDEVIRIIKGHSLEAAPVYQDNGLLEILEKLRNDKG